MAMNHINKQMINSMKQLWKRIMRYLKWYSLINLILKKVYRLNRHLQKIRVNKKIRILWTFMNFN